jgi:hypothetical protein
MPLCRVLEDSPGVEDKQLRIKSITKEHKERREREIELEKEKIFV